MRPSLHESLPIGLPLLNARLLKNDLAQPDGIGVAGLTPRQLTAVFMEPLQQYCSKRMMHVENFAAKLSIYFE
jgi:hypothetical protein